MNGTTFDVLIRIPMQHFSQVVGSWSSALFSLRLREVLASIPRTALPFSPVAFFASRTLLYRCENFVAAGVLLGNRHN